MYKKFNVFVLAGTAIMLGAFALLIYLVDPYYQYHKPYFNMKPVVDNERYQNPGIAKNFEYDSILVGSSMAQNFKVSMFDETFDAHTVKLTYSAVRTGNLNHMLSKSFATHEIKQVFMGLDIDPLLDTPGAFFFPIPEYLYDEDIFNDTNYLLNKSVFLGAAKNQIEKNLNDTVPNIDDAYMWGSEADFSKENALKSVTWDLSEFALEEEHPEYVENAKVNLDQNILPHIKNNPDTTFYIFYPPYSLLWWNLRLNLGDLESVLDLLRYTSNELLKYDNVKLFGFQNVSDLVTDLEKYKDYNHYNHETNNQIIEWMKQDEYVIGPNQVDAYILDLETLIRNFDYTSFE